jgi:4-aminobutyrate aminotransferase-like enzyme
LNLQTRLPCGHIISLALQQKNIGADLAVKDAAQNNMNPIKTGDKFSATFCDRIPLVIEKSLGISVSDSDYKPYLDLRSGWGVASLGHSQPIITDALITQSTNCSKH